jgi:hypothetical protein
MAAEPSATVRTRRRPVLGRCLHVDPRRSAGRTPGRACGVLPDRPDRPTPPPPEAVDEAAEVAVQRSG